MIAFVRLGRQHKERVRAVAGSLLATLLLGGALLMPSACPVWAQSNTTATLSGTVTDPSGAVLSGAAVTVKNMDTGITRSTISLDGGGFVVPELQPGKYELILNQAGFKKYDQQNIVLTIGQRASLAVQLQVGSEQEQVLVTASEVPVIQTDDSSIGQVIDSQAIQNTPLNGRLSVMGLIALAPGMQGVGAQDQAATRGLTVAAGTGSRNSYGGLGILFDGVINKEITLQRGEPEIPSLDALSQFKVLSTGAPAEFNEPTQIIVASASGTNQYHGELFEYNRSKGTSAKSFFNGSSARAPYERNEFGGNFAGPVFIPHVYQGKDRTFFFFAYEGFKLTQSKALSTVQPTALMRTGDFSELTTTTLKDPSTGKAFASNNVIPSGRINSVSQQLMSLLIPTPTKSGVGSNTNEMVPYKSDIQRISLRVDHKISENDNIRFTWLRAFYGPNTTTGNDSLQGGNSGDGEHNSHFILGYTHTFTPTLVLDTNFDFFHLPLYRTPQNVSTDFAAIIPGLATQLINGAPHINFTSSSMQAIGETGSKDLEQAVQLNGSLTKVFAHHTVKVGGSYVYDNHWNLQMQGGALDSNDQYEHGRFDFNGQYTGYDFADFLLGLPQLSAQATPASLAQRNISSQWAGYIQDDWKPISKLTVNAGIRYDLQWFQPGPYNQNSLWIPSLSKIVIFGNTIPTSISSKYTSDVMQYVTTSASAGLPNNVFSYLERPTKNFAPRLGFAYGLTQNTVVRGAFGIYFNLIPSFYVNEMMGNLPFTSLNTYTNSTTYASAFTMSNAFSSSSAVSSQPSVAAIHPLVTPYTEEYNLAVERQLPKGISLRVGYVGQHNLKQTNHGGSGNTAPDLNLYDPAGSSYDFTKTKAKNRPYASLGEIDYNMDPIFHSTMNSLQVGVHKQYDKNLSVGAEYQWVRVLGVENFENPTGKYMRDSYGPISGITPQVLQLNYTYALPIGQGQFFLSRVNNTINKALKGWEISGVVNAQSGQPFSVSYSASSSKYPGVVSGRANRTAGAALYPANKTRSQWFNSAAFAAPTGVVSGTSVNGAAYGTSGYNLLRGPGFQDWDMNLKKNTAWHGHYNLQLRADVFNAFNHPNFAVPTSSLTSSNYTKVTSIASTPSYQARTIEFAAKFNF